MKAAELMKTGVERLKGVVVHFFASVKFGKPHERRKVERAVDSMDRGF